MELLPMTDKLSGGAILKSTELPISLVMILMMIFRPGGIWPRQRGALKKARRLGALRSFDATKRAAPPSSR